MVLQFGDQSKLHLWEFARETRAEAYLLLASLVLHLSFHCNGVPLPSKLPLHLLQSHSYRAASPTSFGGYP